MWGVGGGEFGRLDDLGVSVGGSYNKVWRLFCPFQLGDLQWRTNELACTLLWIFRLNIA